MGWIALLVGAYFLGSIPVGYLVARAKGIDIMSRGSGNIGATNVMRELGRTAGLIVFVLDALKGYIPAAVAHYAFERPDWLGSSQEFAFIAGAFAILGHCLSPFLGFKGGKGVATSLGVIIGTSPLLAGTIFGIFLLMLLFTRYVSLSSIVAVTALPILGWVYKDPATLIGAYIALMLLVIYRHRSNIERLRNGTERKFTFGSKKEPPNQEFVGERP